MKIKNLVNTIYNVDKNFALVAVPSDKKIDNYLEIGFKKGFKTFPLIEQIERRNKLSIFFKSFVKMGGGGVTLKIQSEDNTFDVFGLFVKSNGECMTVPMEEMTKAYTTCNECGEPVPLPENILIRDWEYLIKNIMKEDDTELKIMN